MSPRALEAVVLDLDGVVTRTARVHFATWKRLFDDLLSSLEARTGGPSRPFVDQDYRAYVDGRPRLDGIRAFAASRGLELTEGSADDPADARTVHGLGRRKNQLFAAALEELGVEVDAAAVELVRSLRERGVRVGLATSSRNARAVLRRAGLEGLFEARVDGVVAAEQGLRGKPAPDIFLACARALGATSPERTVVVEDAASGVAAGRAGAFGLVVGVDRGGNGLRLREAGADWVVRDLRELSPDRLAAWLEGRKHRRPNLLAEWRGVAAALRGKRLVVFLDYDGTLTPIVERPELAVLDGDMRATLQRLAALWPTHVISGRGVDDVRRLLGLDSTWVAGSHGFDISPPHGRTGGLQVAPELEPAIHRTAEELRRAIEHVAGVLVEDKRFAIAVHYRQVAEERVGEVARAVDGAATRHPELRKTLGKKVFQLEPAMPWDKGRALRWLLEATGERDGFPVFVGDDATDEAALREVAGRGLGVVVTDLPRPTAARHSLQSPGEVRVFLERLIALGREASP